MDSGNGSIPAAASRSQGWLFGPGRDLVLGCGLGSLAVLAFQGFTGGALDQWIAPGLLIFVFAVPHYGATLVRVYEPDEDRRKYRFVAFHTTALLVVLFVVGLNSALIGSLILTVYLTWSPWHYTGQNYGIALMLLGRRGVELAPRTKRAIHGSFILSYLLTFIAILGPRETGAFAPVSYGGTVYRLFRLDVPYEWASIATTLIAFGYVGCLVVALGTLLRVAPLRKLGPALLLMTTQAVWFAVPVVVRHWQVELGISFFASTYTALGFIWIAAAHSIQYLWITTYYATGPRAGAREHVTFLQKAVLAGFIVWTVPGILFAPRYLGSLPYESGLAVMAAAMVNLHHFILDGVIWKLRDGRVARILLAREPAGSRDASQLAGTQHGPRWVRRGMWCLGALSLTVTIAIWWEGDRGFLRALEQGDLPRAHEALARLDWLGADGPTRRVKMGRRMARDGNLTGAMAEFEHSLRLHPTSQAWTSIGQLQEQRGRWKSAAEAYAAAAAYDPDDASALYRSGRAWLKAGEPDAALPLLERAVVLAPDERLVQLALERARREMAEAGAVP